MVRDTSRVCACTRTLLVACTRTLLVSRTILQHCVSVDDMQNAQFDDCDVDGHIRVIHIIGHA